MAASSTKRPRTKPPQVRREDLMNAAQALFLRLGVGPTTIEQIAAGADVAKGTFYLHFSSKEAVLTALRARYLFDFQGRVQAALERHPCDDWKGRLAAWAQAAVNGYLDTVPVHDLVFHEIETDGSHPDIVLDYLSSFLADGSAAGAWTLADPRFTAVFLVHGLHGVVDEAKTDDKPEKRGRLTRELQQTFFRVVGIAGTVESS